MAYAYIINNPLAELIFNFTNKNRTKKQQKKLHISLIFSNFIVTKQ